MSRRQDSRPADPSRRTALKRLAALGLLALTDSAALVSCGPPRAATRTRERKVIVLGLDGLDPGRVARLMAQGRLPKMKALGERGSFGRLTSTLPPQSPVAWATFITGQDPGGHGLYDFIHRDPATYLPHFSIARTEPPSRTLSLGDWRLPLSHAKVESLRKGRTFWEVLEAQGVPCDVYRLPSNFPPTNTATRQLAGLGAPDLRGTYGEFSFFTDDPKAGAAAGDAATRVEIVNGCARTQLVGPADTLRVEAPPAAVEFTIYVDAARRLAKLVFPGEEVLLKQGEWSDWVAVSFEMLPHLARASGICRFYLKQVAPHFQLYATPVNVDPMDPALPICAPADFAKELAEKHGRFYTQGFPEDVKALRNGVLDDGEYLQQAGQCLEEERRMYTSALHEFSRGLLCYYFSATDRTQHMFWRTMDPRHPAYRAQEAREYGPAIDDCYRMADALVGEAMEAADGDTTLIVMSDHGFAPYYRSFNLNGWLAGQGYLQGNGPWSAEQDLFANADWARTQAYGIGFNALYVNLQDREASGSVSPGDREELLRRLKQQLLAVRDSETGARVIAGVYDRSDFRDEIPDRAPDLIVGYVPGYRVSDASVLGGVAGKLVEDNLDKWSGDHCIDHAHVPGMLLTNRPARLEAPGLPDVTATLLAEFGAEQPAEMIGKPAV